MPTRSVLEGLLSSSAAELYVQVLAGEREPPLLSSADTCADTRELVEKGFLQPSPMSQHVLPAAPERAVEHLVLATQQDLTRRQGLLLSARDDAYALQRVYEAQRALTEDDGSVEVFTDPEAIGTVSHDVWIGAHHDIAQFHTPHFRDQSVLTDERAIEVPPPDMNGRVRMRAVYERSLLDIPGTLDVLRREVAAGMEVRIAPSLPLEMCIVDRRVSLLPLDSCANRVVLIRSEVVAAAHMMLFEQAWKQAVPFGTASAVPDTMTATERAVLTVVAAGMKDEAAARQLRMSTRTLRRHLTALEASFGVDNRVSLAVAAAKQGLL